MDEVPKGDGWLYELKYGDYRMLCRINKSAVELFFRSSWKWTAKLTDHAKTAADLRVVNA